MSKIDDIIIKKEDVIRFAILFGDSDAKNFNSNLRKMLELILHRSFPEGMSVIDIIDSLKDLYQMEFSKEEIEDVFRENKKSRFLIQNIGDNIVYSITPECYRTIDTKYSEKSISETIKKFLEDNEKFSTVGLEKIEEIINKYIYIKFNKDTKTLNAILEANLDSKYVYEDEKNDEFTEDEKDVLNTFFTWEDEKKDTLLYEFLSSALQYCMMTAKKDNPIGKTIFEGKVFYLDSNIVFRLAGFNQEERRKAIETFIKKCKECGIRLKYTNFTKFEIDETIDSAVLGIAKMIQGKEPIGEKAMQSLNPNRNTMNGDWYPIYARWTKDVNNNYNDYKNFRIYLGNQVKNVLKGFEMEEVETFSGKKTRERFDAYCEDLAEYKKNNGRDVKSSAIKTDVENYMFMDEINKCEDRSSFIDKRTFFISADQKLVNWAALKKPGTVPIFVRPSLWYSFMLRYCGRTTQDDFSSFCQFLKLIPKYKEDKLERTRNTIALEILKLDETSAIKDEIAIDVSERLRTFKDDLTNGLTNEEVNAIINESIESVVQKKVSSSVDKKWKEKENEYKCEINETALESKIVERNRIIQVMVDTKVKRNKTIRIVLSIVFAISLVYLGLCIFKNIQPENSNDMMYQVNSIFNNSIIQFLFTIVVGLLKYTVKELDLFTVDKDKLTEHFNKVFKE